MNTATESLHVLHVDDESDVAEVAAEFLEREDERFAVDTATSASDGLDFLTDTDYDCIISDYEMPRQDGIEFLEAVRERHPDLPFILYTGKGTEAIASEAITAGVTDYLQKGSGTDQYTVLANRVTNAVEQYRSTQRTAHLERIRRVVKDANKALLRAETRSEIKQQICEVISDTDPYLFAWFGEHDPDAQTVEPRAAAGIEEGYLTTIEITTDEQATAQGPMGQAVRTQETVVEQEIAETPEYVPWREAALDRGYQSSAAIPITRDNSVLGVLNVYADRPWAFDDEEQELLAGLAADTGQALDRSKLTDRLQFFGETVEAAGHSIYATDTEGTIEYVNPAFEAITGYTAEEAVGRNPRILQSGEHDEAFYEELWDTILAGDVWRSKLINTTKSGDRYVVDQTIAPVRDEDETIKHFVAVNSDVTELKERGQAFERYAALFDNATDAIALVEYRDETPVIRDANPAFEALFAGGEEDIVGRDIDEVVASGDQVAEARAISQQVQEGELVRTNLTRETDDGIRTFDWQVVPIEDSETGEIKSTFTIYTDITELKEREQTLREEREFITQALDTLDDAFYVVGTDGTMRRWNDRLAEVTGYTDEEIADMQATDFFTEDGQEKIADGIDETLTTGGAVADTEVLTADGDCIPYEFTGARLTDTDGDLVGLIGVGRDITERKERERELERYETLVEVAGDMLYMLDDEGHFTYVNEALVETIGYSKETLLGEHVSKVMEVDHVERGEQLIESLLSAGERQGTFEMDFVKASGERIPIENHLSLLYSDGEFHGTVGVLRDITDRLERERQLKRERDKLDEFAGVVSHDLRNPLNVAKGRLDLAMEDCESEHLGPVAQAHERMESLIDDVLSLARAGESVGEPEPVELADLVDACWQNVETAAAELVVETETTIQADAKRLQQLFENLVRNAVEHGGEAVTITIGDLPDGFYVEDDGPGIPEDERGNVLDAGYSTAKDGTGLGLSIVREVAETHGWEISVTESSDGGARFEIVGVQMES
jgi:PAS domain S-box-containing protein